MAWVAVDRCLRLADKRSFPGDRTRWLKVRDDIYECILNEGWNRKRKAFVQALHYINTHSAEQIAAIAAPVKASGPASV